MSLMAETDSIRADHSVYRLIQQLFAKTKIFETQKKGGFSMTAARDRRPPAFASHGSGLTSTSNRFTADPRAEPSRRLGSRFALWHVPSPAAS